MKRDSKYHAVVDTPLGRVGLRVGEQGLRELDFVGAGVPLHAPANALSRTVAEQIQAYFSDPATGFSVPLEPSGTAFQRQVWDALRRIPSGQTRTYGSLAAELGSSPRAVGGACRANPIPVIVPCHRVVAVNGLGGFAGKTAGPVLERKRRLLAHERGCGPAETAAAS
jgi:methylated-DNA-[protein]-cysteine S-methyltransferase